MGHEMLQDDGLCLEVSDVDALDELLLVFLSFFDFSFFYLGWFPPLPTGIMPAGLTTLTGNVVLLYPTM